MTSPPAVTEPAVRLYCFGSNVSVSMVSIPRVLARTAVASAFPATLRLSAVRTADVMRGAPPRSGKRTRALIVFASAAKGAEIVMASAKISALTTAPRVSEGVRTASTTVPLTPASCSSARRNSRLRPT